MARSRRGEGWPSWVAIKIPQLTVEAKFLGADFMLVRLALTVPAAIVMGWLIQKAIERTGGPRVAPPGPKLLIEHEAESYLDTIL